MLTGNTRCCDSVSVVLRQVTEDRRAASCVYVLYGQRRVFEWPDSAQQHHSTEGRPGRDSSDTYNSDIQVQHRL